MNMEEEVIVQWLNVLDRLSYYEIFNVEPHVGFDDLKAAYYTFAETFHPDAHVGRPRRERDAIATIFKRGNEAYRILSNPTLRQRYDELLAVGEVRPIALSSMPPPVTESIAPQPVRLVDKIKKPNARPFAIRAEELFKKGDAKQAKIQLVLAMHLDSGNPALEEFMREIETAIAQQAEAEKKKWQHGGGQ
jgi:curved DNA-binding protein CbpA